MNEPIVKFDIDLSKLTANQKSVLKLLVEAAELIAPIYLEQENHNLPGSNFYPADVTKDQILEAAKEDPELLSPYTIVERDNGKLVAVPYHQKYAELLKPVAEKLQQAAELTDDKEFSQSLKVQAEVLLNGDYPKATQTWMEMKPYLLDVNIGPSERYDDKLMFIKTSYQAWVGVMDKVESARMTEYKDMILTARRKVLFSSEKVDYFDKVQTRVDDLVISTGLKARNLPVGTNLPNNFSLMEKLGSEITLFKQSNDLRTAKNRIVFNQLFSEQFKAEFSEEDLREGSLYSTALHELAHTYLRYRDSEKRLQDLFPVIDELAATVMGVKVCGALLVKDIVTQKQLESIMLAYMIRSFNNILNERDNPSRLHYTVGGAIFINYLRENGALKETGGVSWPNFMKMYVSVDELATILERILSQGTRSDAEHLITRYGSLSVFPKVVH